MMVNIVFYRRFFYCKLTFLGHLIWRLSKFKEKMDEAKHYDSVIHSPMFLNKPFGYTLRVRKKAVSYTKRVFLSQVIPFSWTCI